MEVKIFHYKRFQLFNTTMNYDIILIHCSQIIYVYTMKGQKLSLKCRIEGTFDIFTYNMYKFLIHSTFVLS